MVDGRDLPTAGPGDPGDLIQLSEQPFVNLHSGGSKCVLGTFNHLVPQVSVLKFWSIPLRFLAFSLLLFLLTFVLRQ